LAWAERFPDDSDYFRPANGQSSSTPHLPLFALLAVMPLLLATLHALMLDTAEAAEG
jgi:hypothetical protein